MSWYLFQLELIVAVALMQPVLLDNEAVAIALPTTEDARQRERIRDAARSPTQNVLLVLKGVEAKGRTDVSWEVHVEPAGSSVDRQGAYLVGVVSLFGREHESAELVFPLDQVIIAAGDRELKIRFVPLSGVVVNGVPQSVPAGSSVRIGEISVVIETANR